MKHVFAVSILLAAMVGCATAGGAAAGAGISAIAGGDPAKGALIGGSIGAVVDILD